jgi:hypothetical protein
MPESIAPTPLTTRKGAPARRAYQFDHRGRRSRAGNDVVEQNLLPENLQDDKCAVAMKKRFFQIGGG